MSIVKKFELGAILSMTTGYSCVDDFDEVWKLVWFVCDDNMIGPMGLGMVKDEVKSHLLAIHPELKNVKYQKGKDIHEFVSQQEEKFGSVLPVTKLGVKLPEEYTIKTSSYVPSNDSEVIANLIDGLEYDPSKTDEILAKYENLGKSEGLVKRLKPTNKNNK